jgi:integrase
MPLTDTAIKKLKATGTKERHSDEKGLYLEISPAGGKWWRLKYRIGGKEKLLSMGTYPEVTLAQARERRDEARKLIADGVDPSESRKAEKAANLETNTNLFEVLAREWFANTEGNRTAYNNKRTIGRLERDIFPTLGNRPISTITAPELLEVLRKVQARGVGETAHRELWSCGQIFRYAVQKGKATRDITGDLKGGLKTVKPKNFAAITEPKEVGALLRSIYSYEGYIVVNSALKLAPLVFVRPGELRAAKWENIDLVTAEWRYTVTKTDSQHIVPLSKQAVAVLAEIKAVTGEGVYVFPSARTGERPMSDAAVNAALRRMGIAKEEMTGHGFRAMARTILDEVLGYRPDIIEHQLAHQVKDPNGRAYNRTAHLPERKKMMQAWANYLDKLRVGADVVVLSKVKAK